MSKSASEIFAAKTEGIKLEFHLIDFERAVNFFIANRDALLEYIRAGEALAPELRALADIDITEQDFLATLDALTERMEQ